MHKLTVPTGALLSACALLGILALPGAASGAGKIVCWKDNAGKVIGCGDKIPPEFQSSATKELDSRGVTRRTTESVEEGTLRRGREQEAARLKGEEDRKLIDLKRQDTALLQTYSNEKEIDLKRDRDLQVVDLQMEQLTTALKSAAARYSEVKGRAEATEKANKPISPALKDDLARAASDKERLEERIDAKQKEKDELRKRYADYKKRYTDLRNGAVPGYTPVAATK